MDPYQAPPPYNPKEEQQPLQPQQHQQLYPSVEPSPGGPQPYYPPSGPQQYPAPGAGPYPYPPQGPPQTAGGPVYIMNPPTVITVGSVIQVPQFGYSPVRTICHQCHSDVVTLTQHEVGTMAWLICGMIILAGLLLIPCALLGCCFIPFCINDCKDVIHYCPACKQALARVPRLK